MKTPSASAFSEDMSMSGFDGGAPKDFIGIARTIYGSLWKLHKREALIVIACAVSAGALQAYAPQILQQIIDGFASGSFASAGGAAAFYNLLIIFSLMAIGGLTLRIVAEKVAFYIATRVEDYWRFVALRKYYELPISWHDQQDSGEVASRIDRGGSAVWTIIYELFGQVFFTDFITLLFILPLAYAANQSFFWVLFLPIPVISAATYFISKKIAEGQNELNRLDKLAQKALYDGTMNIRTVKAFGKEIHETDRYKQRWSAYHEYEYGLERIFFIQSALYNTMDVGTRTLLLFVSLSVLLNAQVSIGQVVLLLTYQQLVFYPLTRLNSIFTRIRRHANRAKVLFTIVDESDKANSKARPLRLGALKEKVEFKKVSFRYIGGEKAVRDVTFTIPQGSTVALVGRSGSGKTTIASMLAGFYTPTRGAVLWDGSNIAFASPASIAKQVSFVAQDSTLFNRSIKLNIAYANEHAEEEEVVEAAQHAHVHDFVTAMRKKYESIIGERGVRLSGGQRQRIALARALLAKGSLLILDESTSQLDSESERAIRGAIEQLKGHVTQVIIAHRLSTVLHADKILVMDKGRIVASGKHKELLKKSKIYRKLYELQFQD